MKRTLPEGICLPATKTMVIAMRLTLLLLIAGCLQVSARGYAQKISFSGTDIPLQQVFSVIEEQTGYGVFMDHDLLQDARKVTVNAKDASIDAVLKDCFKNQPFPLTYTIVGHTINIIKKRPESINLEESTLADEARQEVGGVVKGEDGKPLVGANVKIRKLNKSGQTDAKGEFIFQDIPNGRYVIEISYVGHEDYRREIKVENNLVKVTVVMKISISSLDANVVKGYYNTTARFNTGNVTTVKGEDIIKQPVSDPLLALQGRVPGLYIQQTSGLPGSYSTILLRGQNSLPLGKPVTVNDPFFIVDGVPFSSASLSSTDIGGGAVGNPLYGRGQGLSPFNSLNPADIESIEVLKDADATAIYGSRGSNGVILITTRKGKAGQTKVDIDVSSGGGRVSRNVDLLNTKQYLQVRHEAFINDGVTPDPNVDFDMTYWDTTRYTNWQKVLLGNTANYTNVQSSLSGGNANTQFHIGGGFNHQGTVFPGDYSSQKASILFNINNISSNQKFRIQFTGNYVYNNSKIPMADFTGSITLAPDAPAIYNSIGNINWQLKGGGATWLNPMAATHLQANAITDNLISNLTLSYQISHDFQVKSSFGYTKTQMNQTQLAFSSASPPPDNASPYSRSNSFATTTANAWIIEPQIEFHKQVSNWVIDALLGSTFQQNTQKSLSETALGFSSDELITDPNAASLFYLNGYNYSLYRYNAVFGRVGVRWKDRYLLNFTARRDGSSRFGPSKQFGNFGAVGPGWIFSEEPFMKNKLPWMNFGKLRASYGLTGNDAIGDYQFLSTYSINRSTYQEFSGLYPTLLSNPNFAWEQDKKLEGGIELRFLKDRIQLTISYYRNQTGNQLVGFPLPQITGFTSVQANLPAVIQNTGWELSFNTINIKTTNFAWISSFNISIPKNKLASYPGIKNSPYAFTYSVGKSLFAQYLFHFTGVDPQKGIYTFANKNGSGIPSFGIDQELTKPVTQEYYGGFSNTFQYKGWNLDVFFQFVKQVGHGFLNAFGLPPGFSTNMPVNVLDRWQKNGDIANAQQFTQSFATAASTAYSYIQASDAIISDASFVRLKNVSLSYRFPSEMIKKIGIKNASAFINCENLLTITKYKLLDPEVQGLGLPPLRMITAGIHMSL
ncbi:SusC/RagA family TonB-linked outer membrane protein [Flavitalea flava]